MIETTSHQLKPITISNQVRIVNPAILKVIANTIRQSVEGDTLTMKLRILFLDDLIRLFQSAHENRKIMLQQSVWQDWLLALGSLKPTTDDEYECQEKVYKLLNILLHHSIKWEWGGWRVWVDTMALIHSSVARCNHKENLDMLYARDEEVEESEETDNAKEDESRDHVKEAEEKVPKTEDEPPTYSECEGEKSEAEVKPEETPEEISEDAPSPKPEDNEVKEEVSVDQVEPVIEDTPEEAEKSEEVEDETSKESETPEDNTKTEEKSEETSETTPDTTPETTEDKTEEKPQEAENEAEDEPEGISKELAAQLSLQDDELEENREGNDSETVEVGSNDEEDKMTSHEAKRRSLSPTEELSATKISEISENSSNPPPPTTNGMNWSPAPRTPGAFRIRVVKKNLFR